MSADDAPTESKAPEALQFDRVETTSRRDAAASPGVTCAVCAKPVELEYYTANGKPVCDGCRHVLTSATATPRSAGPLIKAGIFGLGAAIAGAAIYYAVIAIANLEIGIVAILIGYMVGYAVRKGARGRGGLRFQVLAALLTYGAVGLAYTSLAVKAGIDERRAAHANGAQASADAPSAGAEAGSGTARSVPSTALFLAYAAGLVAVLPVLVVIGSMPSGFITALIIFFGIRQAMRMTAAPVLQISGPFRIGTSSSAPTTA